MGIMEAYRRLRVAQRRIKIPNTETKGTKLTYEGLKILKFFALVRPCQIPTFLDRYSYLNSEVFFFAEDRMATGSANMAKSTENNY